jgi:HAD superfamily hydrolase (TIGR01484 family)
MTMKTVSEIPNQILKDIRFVLTDIDDTLTLHGRLPAIAYDALERLRDAGLKVIPITGRPAGWCDHIARMWPVDGVVGENGAFYFRYDQASRQMMRVYAQDLATRLANRARLEKIAEAVLQAFPGTAIASDQAYREIDVAIDFAEDVVPLPLGTAQKIAEYFHAAGAVAKVSSIHVNAWFGAHDKLTMSLRMLSEVHDLKDFFELNSIVYLGDSPNDAPMFAHFPNSIGVANLMHFATLMPHLPCYITNEDGGIGFAEFANILLAAKNNS